MKDAIYVVTMYRLNNREAHSYVHFAGHKKLEAQSRAIAEEMERGGKYVAEILKFDQENEFAPSAEVPFEHHNYAVSTIKNFPQSMPVVKPS